MERTSSTGNGRGLGRRRGRPLPSLPLTLLVAVGLMAGLAGCSEYRDPYSGICPTLEDLEVRDLTPTSATLFWRSDHLMLAHILYRPSNGLERIYRGQELGLEHQVVLADLFPETSYRVTLIKDIGDQEDQVVPCGANEELSFRTPRLAPVVPGYGQTVPDPETSVHPSG